MNERCEFVEAKQVDSWLPKILGAKFSLAMTVLVVLCASALAQEDTADYWINKGDKLYTAGSYKEAIEAYDNAIQIDPSNAQAWLGKGYVLDNLAFTDQDISNSNNLAKTLELSIQAFDRALELDPKNAYAWHGKGVTLIHL